jgi:hypothetical protein
MCSKVLQVAAIVANVVGVQVEVQKRRVIWEKLVEENEVDEVDEVRVDLWSRRRKSSLKWLVLDEDQNSPMRLESGLEVSSE